MNKEHTDALLLAWDQAFNQRQSRRVATRGPRPLPGQAAGSSASADAVRQRLRGNVRRTPQAMVRISGGGRGMRHIRAHLDYISRNGQLAVEGPDGEVYLGREEVRWMGDEWQHGGVPIADEASRREAVNIVLSMPEGTDAQALLRAVRDFAHDEFADHQYAMVLHRYEDDPSRTPSRHPHVHLCVKKTAPDGRRLNPRKEDLRRWRGRFAEQLRYHGIDATASSRIERFEAQKGLPQSVYQLRKRDGARGPQTWATSPVVKAAAQLRQQAMLQRYASVAKLLAGAEDGEDRQLGVGLVTLCEQGIGKPRERDRTEQRPR
ncbi:relaxase/mobilization nuclease domain-containing protein [Duganella levis]|uniref:MobA/VirD2-like nuclease domain-containing protein n=1 Tax=Duganella levis TaxID=2692169 RepID=A0ABW9VT56_9BURK|nr:hypothetical protein [Duganella levis]MYN24811.1 hypothetical protein [Duganella levis]